MMVEVDLHQPGTKALQVLEAPTLPRTALQRASAGMQQAKRSREQKDTAEAKENAGKVMRKAALQHMKDRKKGSDGDAHLSERPS
ncbi:unnamed protein product [Phytophthora fragariaefolia]|uniref:Unnamed protein product n=1 Tax=Phytophthora fragariaefolia TaxID=1490495 RepID=A0A9W6XR07_9STRA|nr:unnamed protein product [Phytophthora fragariaefolia]